MLIGKVVGSVGATQKDEKLEDLKFLVVRVRSHENEPKDQYVVAVDSVQGEWFDSFDTGTARTGGKSQVMTSFVCAYCSNAASTC